MMVLLQIISLFKHYSIGVKKARIQYPYQLRRNVMLKLGIIRLIWIGPHLHFLVILHEISIRFMKSHLLRHGLLIQNQKRLLGIKKKHDLLKLIRATYIILLKLLLNSLVYIADMNLLMMKIIKLLAKQWFFIIIIIEKMMEYQDLLILTLLKLFLEMQTLQI